MKDQKLFIKILAVCLLVMLFHSCSQKSKDVSAEIRDANKGFTEAFGKSDAKSLAQKYTSNAKLFPANSDVVEGREAIEGFWNAVMGMGLNKAELETLTAESFGDVAIEEGRYKLYAGGDQPVDEGKYIVTWAKEEGQWKLQRDIWTTNSPAPVQRAALNDTVWVIENYIKPDMVKQFEAFNFNYLEPATAKHYPKMRSTVRTLKPTHQNPDKTFTYYYLMDAATSPDGYDMMLPLTAAYGETKAKEYLKMFEECLKSDQVIKVTTQTSW